ncbi:MAG: DUF4292 domain-containing protein [Candidatus Hydrogenedentes bacterium]|nr:DUF4292 domain-containing protein [Candidatus Hydrogenedentota bacterium]
MTIHHPRVWTISLLLVLSAGCATVRRQHPVAGFPSSNRALADMFITRVVARESSLRNIRSRAKISLESPDLDRRVTFRGFMAFATPDRLRVQGHSVLGIDACDLISNDGAFYLSIPSQKKVFYQREGVAVDGMAFSVSPSDIVREIFIPFGSVEIRTRNLRIVNRTADTASIEYTSGSVRRVVTVDRQWRVLNRARYDDGMLTCTVAMTDYELIDGILFPRHIEAIYPARKTSITMDLDGVEINRNLDPKLFEMPVGLQLRKGR